MAKPHCPRQEKDVDGMSAHGDDADASQQGGQQSSASLPLWVVPPDTLSTILLPLLATRCIVGTLSLVRKAFHAIAADPSNHHTVFIHSHKPIHLTHTQLGVWPPRLSQTKRAVLICPVTESVTSLIEGMRRTLAYLHLDEPASQLHRTPRLLSMRQGASLVEFPALEEMRVGGEWVQAARRKRWALSSLVSLSIRNGPLSGRRGDLGVSSWLSFASRLRSFELDDGEDDSGTLRSYVPDLTTLKTLRLTSRRPCFGRAGAMQLEEIDVALLGGWRVQYTQSDEGIDEFRKSCLAPGAKEDWSRSDLRFDVHVLWQRDDDAAADTTKLLASVATQVYFDTSLSSATETHSSTLSRLIPSLVFSRARYVMVVGDPARPRAPEIVLSHVPRLFPCVTRAEVMMVNDLGDAVMQRVLGHLPMLEAVVLNWLEGHEDIEMCMWVDQTEKERPIVERIRHITARLRFHFEQGDRERFIEVTSVIRDAIRQLPRLERIVVDITVGGEGWEGQEDIVATLQQDLTSRPDTNDFTEVPFHLLLRESGFEMVELPRLAFDCRVEVRRLGLPIPSQKRITDYFSARQTVR
ncbi:unnamed protein product [Vitrella brassicaformis CCMP3155]|uniref:Uncharacterized protein n=1 Tax=Vitrella brassicaformis (strain CCMP3155) TaxID=1169540 RepID=A0A0G4ESP8_VITBC|nr:unnamed protein product [Vitrella brassicaformis CCMP3155]|eukprot:CEM01082.1 unnamed protein product [Vitrella brassicaformis CCMP3155]